MEFVFVPSANEDTRSKGSRQLETQVHRYLSGTIKAGLLAGQILLVIGGLIAFLGPPYTSQLAAFWVARFPAPPPSPSTLQFVWLPSFSLICGFVLIISGILFLVSTWLVQSSLKDPLLFKRRYQRLDVITALTAFIAAIFLGILVGAIALVHLCPVLDSIWGIFGYWIGWDLSGVIAFVAGFVLILFIISEISFGYMEAGEAGGRTQRLRRRRKRHFQP